MGDSIIASAYDTNGTQAPAVQRVMARSSMLENERATWLPGWRDINDYIQPNRGRFFLEDKNKGDRKDLSIINNCATRASRIKAAGLMAGLTNPGRPWIRYTTPDPDLNEFEPVQRWLGVAVDRTLWVFQRSNVYLALHGAYTDLDFGTAALHIEPDLRRIIRGYLYPIGSYSLALGADGRVDTVYRKFQQTAAQLVDKFGKAAVSRRAQEAYKDNRLDTWFTVLHAIEPNRELERGAFGPRGKAWRSAWLEIGADQSNKFLHVGGFDEFPAMCPRWEVTGEDVYGHGPGHEAIGDARALQTLEKRAGQVVDKISGPATQFPSSLKNSPVSLQPNSHIFTDGLGPAQAVRPVYVPDPRALDSVELKIRQHERRVEQAYGTDMWTMFANDPTGKMTATEVLQRREEKMLMLGPYLQRLEEELLDPLVNRTFQIMLRAGLLPPPPRELQGIELKVEYISVLAQAQKLIGIQGAQELTGLVSSVVQLQAAAGQVPDALDKLNTDQLVDDFGEMLGTPPELVRSDDQVASIRQQRAQRMAQQQAMQQLQQGAETAKTMGDTSLDGNSVLSRMLPAVTGGRAA